MRRARVAFSGAIHEAIPAGDEMLRLADGRMVAEDQVVWLTPFEPGTVVALGLNYADHARELALFAAGIIDANAAFVVNESMLTKLVHELVHPGASGADEVCQSRLADFGQ